MEEAVTARAPRRRASRKSAFARQMREHGYLTCTEVVQRVHVHKTTLYRWIRDGLVVAEDCTGAYYVEWASVVSHLAGAAKILQLTGDIDADMASGSTAS